MAHFENPKIPVERPSFDGQQVANVESQPTDVSDAQPMSTWPEARSHIEDGSDVPESQEELEDLVDQNDPYERVEDFLLGSASLFEDSRNAWREVRASISKLDRSEGPSLSDIMIEAGIPRHQRRGRNMRKLLNGDWWTMVDSAHQRAQILYRDFAMYERQPLIKDEAGQRNALDDYAKKRIEKAPESVKAGCGDCDECRRRKRKGESVEVPIDEDVQTDMQRLTESYNSLAHKTAVAYLLEDQITDKLKLFLKDPAVAAPFAERLKQTAAENAYPSEFPGLLEALANHTRKYGNANLLTEALSRVEVDNIQVAQDFLTAQFEKGDKKLSQSMEAIVFATRVLVQVEGGEAVSLSSVAERFAHQYAAWPMWLKRELSTFTDQRKAKENRSLLAALEPFVNEARLKDMYIKPNATSSKRTRDTTSKEIDVAVLRQSEGKPAAEPEKEKPPITRFGYLRNIGDLANSRTATFQIRDVEGIDGLMAHRTIRNYLGKHKGADLEDTLRAALMHLTSNAFDHETTRRMVHATYRLEDTGKRAYNMRRLSLQKFPGVNKTSIASKTRILYNVVKGHPEGPQIVLYGVFHKQDIENIHDYLPPR